MKPTLEYANEVWEGNKSQAAALKSGEEKCNLGCSSKTSEAVSGIWDLKNYRS